METRKTDPGSGRPKPKFGAGSMILIACCVTVAIVGIFIGAIIIYGGSHANF